MNDLAIEGGRYYVYGLIDPQKLRETGSVLRSVFYVGKGSKDRLASHEKDELASLRREMEKLEEPGVLAQTGAKRERIRRLLDRGDRVGAVMLSSGYTDETDAYRAETLAMTLLGRLLAGYGDEPLGNLTSGHGQSATLAVLGPRAAETVPVDPIARVSTPEVAAADEPVLELLSVDQALRASTSQRRDWREVITVPTVLVKGTAESMVTGEHVALAGYALDDELAPFGNRIRVLGDVEPGTERERPGYDPDFPWASMPASERGRRYWPIGRSTVAGWLRSPETMPSRLLLAIPGSGGTTVRYAWSLDRDGVFEYFPDVDDRRWDRWGLPLGSRLLNHPALGFSLTERRERGEVQVLANYVSGFRVFIP